MKRRGEFKLVRLVPGIAIPDYMAFLLDYCEPTGYTKKAIEAGHILKIDFHPPYVQLVCRDVERVVEEAKRAGLRVYKGRKHITVTDGVNRARIYMRNPGDGHRE